MNNKYFLYFFAITITLGCSKDKFTSPLEIDLNKVSNKSIAFNNLYTTVHLSSQQKAYPIYYKDLFKQFKGLPVSDSIYLSYHNADFKKFHADLFSKGYINREKINRFKINLYNEKVKPKLKQLNIAIFFKNQKQHIIIDSNNNKDFSDDTTFEFNKDFSEKKTNQLPKHDYKFWQKTDSVITYYNRKIVLIPNSVYYHKRNSRIDQSKLSFRFDDYWEGSFKYKNEGFDVAVNGVYPYLDILIKPKSFHFSENDFNYNQNFNYKIKDTIMLSDSLFVIDNINPNSTKLSLKRVRNSKQFISNKIGNKLYDFTLKNLSGNEFSILDNNLKDHTLIEFWGTWCLPCKKTTPKLKMINKKYSKSLNIIGIAFDKNINEVKKHIAKNNINWVNSFSSMDKKEGIIKALKITKYPTFILLDKNNTIIHKGSGEQSLSEIEKIIKNN